MSVVTASLMLSTKTPEILRGFLAPPYIALSSALACRVFRSLLLRSVRSPNNSEAMNTRNIAEIMQGVRTVEYRFEFEPNFSFRGEASKETSNHRDAMETNDPRYRMDSEATLTGEDPFTAEKSLPALPRRSLDIV